MRLAQKRYALAFGAGALACAAVAFTPPTQAQTPKMGGVLEFVVGSRIPSYDGHAESTFGMIHPIRPFYSLLFRVNPDNPQSATDFLCDLCEGSVPSPTNDGKTYTFKVRKDVKFHDGTPLTAHDIKATYEKLANPPEGIRSTRQPHFSMLQSIEVPDDYTVVFNLKYPSGAFLPAFGQPFNFVYSKKDLDREDPEGKDPNYGYTWHQTNINGTGAFRFKEHQPGAFVEGEKYEGYHHAGKPYLDGFRAIAAPKTATRLNAIRSGRAAIEFRGFTPGQRDDLVNTLGDKITVQESDWNCMATVSMNHTKPPFDDVRVRQALMHGLDRWGSAEALSKVAIVKTVAGMVFPSHPLAIDLEQLKEYVGYWPDAEKAREEARRLLKEAGADGLTFDLHNRTTDMPYRYIGTWVIGEWKKIGVNVTQRAVATSEWYAKFRGATYQVGIDANCQSVVNPVVDLGKYLSNSRSNANYSHYEDPILDGLFDRLQRAGDLEEQKELVRAYEKRILSDYARYGMTMWWYKINPHHSFVKGWKIAPSHYLNQHLDQVWLDRGQNQG